MSNHELTITLLQRQNRLLKILLLPLCALVAIQCLGGWRQTSDVVQAKIFKAVNRQGKEVDSFGGTEQGTGVFKACDSQGRLRALIATDAGGNGRFEIYDDKDDVRLVAGMRSSGGPTYSTIDSSDRIVASMGEVKK